jgi:hypothetical protein
MPASAACCMISNQALACRSPRHQGRGDGRSTSRFAKSSRSGGRRCRYPSFLAKQAFDRVVEEGPFVPRGSTVADQQTAKGRCRSPRETAILQPDVNLSTARRPARALGREGARHPARRAIRCAACRPAEAQPADHHDDQPNNQSDRSTTTRRSADPFVRDDTLFGEFST